MILCENGPDAVPVLFEQALETVVVWEPAELVPALMRLDASRAAGNWIAGYVGYEAGYALEQKLAPCGAMPSAGTPLICGASEVCPALVIWSVPQ